MNELRAFSSVGGNIVMRDLETGGPSTPTSEEGKNRVLLQSFNVLLHFLADSRKENPELTSKTGKESNSLQCSEIEKTLSS